MQRLELLVSSLCLAGTNLLRHPMKPAVRQVLRADIQAARAFLKTGIEPDAAPDERPEPPLPAVAPAGAEVTAAPAAAPRHMWWMD